MAEVLRVVEPLQLDDALYLKILVQGQNDRRAVQNSIQSPGVEGARNSRQVVFNACYGDGASQERVLADGAGRLGVCVEGAKQAGQET